MIAYASRVIAKNSTSKILINMETPVTILLHLESPNFVSTSLIIPTTIIKINRLQYNERFSNVTCVYANKLTE